MLHAAVVIAKGLLAAAKRSKFPALNRQQLAWRTRLRTASATKTASSRAFEIPRRIRGGHDSGPNSAVVTQRLAGFIHRMTLDASPSAST